MWATWAWEVRPCNRRVNWVDRSRSCGTFAQRINLLRPICSVNKGCIRRHTYVQLSRPLPPGQLKSTANSIYSPSVPVCRDCRDKRHDRSMSTARSTDQWQKGCFVSLFFWRQCNYARTTHSVFSVLRQLTTWHCSRFLLTASHAAFNRYLLSPGAQQTSRTLVHRSINGTDRRTYTVPLLRPCRILCEQCQQSPTSDLWQEISRLMRMYGGEKLWWYVLPFDGANECTKQTDGPQNGPIYCAVCIDARAVKWTLAFCPLMVTYTW